MLEDENLAIRFSWSHHPRPGRLST